MIITSSIVFRLTLGGGPSRHLITLLFQWHSLDDYLMEHSAFLNLEQDGLH